jgi:hypothetical protein
VTPGSAGSTSFAPRQHLDVAVQVRQRQQRGARGGRVGARISSSRPGVSFRAQQRGDLRFVFAGGKPVLSQQCAQHADVGHVEAHFGKAGQRDGGQRQFLDLGIGFEAGMAVDLGADLDRLAGGVQARRAGMQHAAGVAQAGDRIAVQQVGVDARDLGRHVGAQAEQASG